MMDGRTVSTNHATLAVAHQNASHHPSLIRQECVAHIIYWILTATIGIQWYRSSLVFVMMTTARESVD